MGGLVDSMLLINGSVGEDFGCGNRHVCTIKLMVPADFSIIHFEDLTTQAFLLIFPFSDFLEYPTLVRVFRQSGSVGACTNFRYLQLVVTSALIQRWINLAEG